MKRHQQRIASHRRRRMPHRRFPYHRFATVMPAGRLADGVPCLRLQGEWLGEAGFFPHWRVKVTVSRGKLLIEPLVDALGLFDDYGVVSPPPAGCLRRPGQPR